MYGTCGETGGDETDGIVAYSRSSTTSVGLIEREREVGNTAWQISEMVDGGEGRKCAIRLTLNLPRVRFPAGEQTIDRGSELGQVPRGGVRVGNWEDLFKKSCHLWSKTLA